MIEKDVEQYLVKEVESVGGKCIKLTGYTGIPDRLCIFPGGGFVFVELKRPRGARVAAAQLVWREQLKRIGCESQILRTKDSVNKLMREYGCNIN